MDGQTTSVDTQPTINKQFSVWVVCVFCAPPHAHSMCSSVQAQGQRYSQNPSCGGGEPLPVMDFLLPVQHKHLFSFIFYFTCSSEINYISQDASVQNFSNQEFPGVALTCGSSSVLRFSRWTSHGSDKCSGRNGRIFGSWLLLGATMVIGVWERERELRWASRDRCSEAPPTSCQKKKFL